MQWKSLSLFLSLSRSLSGQVARGWAAVMQIPVLHRSQLSAILGAVAIFSSVHSSTSSQVLAVLPLPVFPFVMPWMLVFSRMLCLMLWLKYFIFLLVCFRSIDFVLIVQEHSKLSVLWDESTGIFLFGYTLYPLICNVNMGIISLCSCLLSTPVLTENVFGSLGLVSSETTKT